MSNLIPEILAPAGSMESAIAAVRAGADAIYLGAKCFSARASSQNFDDLEMKEVIYFCHSRNVKVYLALNTLISDFELPKALEVVKKSCSLAIDALIVQDMGLAYIVKKMCPKLPLHASTQMTVHTPLGAKLLYDFGFKRIVLSRELTKHQIQEIVDSCPIEVEVFVHGALCVCMSGQCYLSSIIGQRSGNRGQCAQPCRLPFKVEGGNGNDLSLKDMSIIKHIEELREIGVHSLKIEGRMKRPEYVYNAVDICKSTIESGAYDLAKEKMLSEVFSRSGFTDGYYKNKIDKDMYGIREKENVVSATNKLLSDIRNKYRNEKQIIGIDLEISVKKDERIKLRAVNNKGESYYELGEIPEVATVKKISKEKLETSLKKTGKTQFYVKKIHVELDRGLNVSISSINDLRRKVLIGLSDKIAIRQAIPCNDYVLKHKHNDKAIYYDNKKEKLKIRAVFNDTDIPKCYVDCEVIYIPLFTSNREIKRLILKGFKVGVTIPRGMYGIEEKIKKRLIEIKDYNIKHVLVGNIGALEIAKQLDFIVNGDFTLNIYNTYTANTLATLGLTDYIASIELKLTQINKLNATIPKGVIIYGRLPLMTMRSCPQKHDKNNCKTCKSKYNITNNTNKYPKIIDRKKEQFPLICDGNTTSLINSVPINIIDKLQDIKSVDFGVIYINVDNYVDKVNIYSNITNKNYNKASEKSRFTRGLYYRGVY